MIDRRDILSRTVAALAIVAGGLAALGCESSLTGNEGNLLFSYTTDDLTSDFNKPVAVGANLEVRVRTAGDRQSVDLVDVVADDSVFMVDSFSGDSFILEGTGEGNTLVEVVADGPEGETTDSVNMRSAIPQRLELRHLCTGNETAAYTVGREDVFVSFDMYLEDSTDVIGYGYYPVEIPTQLGTLRTGEKDQANIRLDLGMTPGDYVLASTIDEAALTMRLIEEGAITGASVKGADLRVTEGETGFTYVWPEAGEDLVCQARADMTVTSLTPGICDVRNNETPEEAGVFNNPEGWVAIEGLSGGECRFEVTFLNGNEGAGATTELVAQIGTFPGEE